MYFSGSLGSTARSLFTPLVALTLTTAIAVAQPAPTDVTRIVSVGGTVTEIIYALGEQDRIAAVDSTSTYPNEATGKPDVGYIRQLSAEGVLSQRPDLIIAEAGAGPADAVAILKASGVPLISVPTPPEAAAIAGKIRAVGTAIGKAAAAEKLALEVDSGLKSLEEKVATITEPKKRVLFALSLSNGRVMAAGSHTAADEIIRLAGGINAATDVTGYKPLSDEAVIAAAPEVVLVMDGGAMHMTAEQAFVLPALQASPAAKTKAFIAMDGLYLLGLGPRTPQAARDLSAKLYPEAFKP
ncbi:MULTISPECIES: heme/hemin ABC transporter substrate-binding protein [Alphaproteobacteria]|uniref:Hemin ABC transporter substrate-binding protein n=2 Tax=Alphaproteobacteria TaxID=28211 RepID=A0A512HMJ6_9HYPH|nr:MULTISPECIES: ABC transporter substrate-binding protein [Alphaproteobacteria]GEO86674.1 hemin ABC transporter substrate-binding protein [Ciceribacter naphthalenivorans]GLR23596.1 hemin ABC transporter substrate-binding protein [Ciceribacter naphthalenivorans]GLT06452.1 hemin ABC transporter substrate-binding protein [Sphingomonas psychrolutea]